MNSRVPNYIQEVLKLDQEYGYMAQFLCALKIEYPEVYQSLAEQLVVFSGVCCLQREYQKNANKDSNQGFVYFNAIQQERLNQIGGLIYELQQTYKLCPDLLLPEKLQPNKTLVGDSHTQTEDAASLDTATYKVKKFGAGGTKDLYPGQPRAPALKALGSDFFNFLPQIELKLTAETLGLTSQMLPPYAINASPTYARNSVQDKLVVGSQNSDTERVESLANCTAIDMSHLQSQLIEAAKRYFALESAGGLPDVYFEICLKCAVQNLAQARAALDADTHSLEPTASSSSTLSAFSTSSASGGSNASGAFTDSNTATTHSGNTGNSGSLGNQETLARNSSNGAGEQGITALRAAMQDLKDLKARFSLKDAAADGAHTSDADVVAQIKEAVEKLWSYSSLSRAEQTALHTFLAVYLVRPQVLEDFCKHTLLQIPVDKLERAKTHEYAQGSTDSTGADADEQDATEIGTKIGARAASAGYGDNAGAGYGDDIGYGTGAKVEAVLAEVQRELVEFWQQIALPHYQGLPLNNPVPMQCGLNFWDLYGSVGNKEDLHPFKGQFDDVELHQFGQKLKLLNQRADLELSQFLACNCLIFFKLKSILFYNLKIARHKDNKLKLKLKECLNLTLGYALLFLEQPIDPALLATCSLESFKKVCNNVLFKEAKVGELSRAYLYDKDAGPTLEELKANFAQNQAVLQAHQDIIAEYLELRGNVLDNQDPNYQKACTKLFALGWSTVQQLFEITETETEDSLTSLRTLTLECYHKLPKTEGNNLKLQSDINELVDVSDESLVHYLNDDPLELIENQEDAQKLQQLAQELALKQSLDPYAPKLNPRLEQEALLDTLLRVQITDKGRIKSQLMLEDSQLALLKDYYESHEEALSSQKELNAIWRKLVISSSYENSNFLCGLYQILLSNAEELEDLDAPILVELKLSNSTLLALQEPGKSYGMQLFNLMYAPTIRALAKSGHYVFVLKDTSLKQELKLDLSSQQPCQAEAFPLLDFAAYVQYTKTLAQESDPAGAPKDAAAARNLKALNFSVKFRHRPQSFELKWSLPKESVGLCMLKTLERLLSATADSTLKDAAADDQVSTLELKELSEHNLSSGAQAESALNVEQNELAFTTEQIQAATACMSTLGLKFLLGQTSLDLSSGWKKNSKDEQSFDFYLDSDVSMISKADSKLPLSPGQLFIQLMYSSDDRLEWLQSNLRQQGLDNLFMQFCQAYDKSLKDLYHGKLNAERMKVCLDFYQAILKLCQKELSKRSLQPEAKARLKSFMLSLLNIGVVFTHHPGADHSYEAIVLPWNVMRMYAQVLKHKQWQLCFNQPFSGVKQRFLVDPTVLLESAVTLSQQSYAPEIVLTYDLNQESKSNDPTSESKLWFIAQHQSLVDECVLMHPVSSTNEPGLGLYNAKDAKSLCDELQNNYLPYFLPLKSELNLMLYQCTSRRLVCDLYTELVERIADQENPSLFYGMHINLYLVYEDSTEAAQVYQILHSYLDSDAMQTNLLLNNSSEFKRSIQLFVLHKEQLTKQDQYDESRDLKRITVTTLAGSQDAQFMTTFQEKADFGKLFDLTLLFDISMARDSSSPSSKPQNLLWFNASPYDLQDERYGLNRAGYEPEDDEDEKASSSLDQKIDPELIYLPHLSSAMTMIEDPNGDGFDFVESLILQHAPDALKFYSNALEQLSKKNAKLQNQMLPYRKLDNDLLKERLEFVHQHSRLIMCLDEQIFRSTLLKLLKNLQNKQNLICIYYQYNQALQRNILISALHKQNIYEPHQEFNLKKILMKILGEESTDEIRTLMPLMYKFASDISGRIVLRAQYLNNRGKEMIGLVCSGYILECLRQKEKLNLREPDQHMRDTPGFYAFAHGQLMLDDNLTGLYTVHNAHADLLGINIYKTYDEEQPQFLINLYVVESKFRTTAQDSDAKSQLESTCRPLNLLLKSSHAAKLQPSLTTTATTTAAKTSTTNTAAHADAPNPKAVQASFAKQIVLSWLNNRIYNVAEQHRSDETIADVQSLRLLSQQLLQHQVSIKIHPVICMFEDTEPEFESEQKAIELTTYSKQNFAKFIIKRPGMAAILREIGQLDPNKALNLDRTHILPKLAELLEKLLQYTPSGS